MNRVIHALNNILTSFDLRDHISRVDVEFATYYRGRKLRIELKMGGPGL